MDDAAPRPTEAVLEQQLRAAIDGGHAGAANGASHAAGHCTTAPHAAGHWTSAASSTTAAILGRWAGDGEPHESAADVASAPLPDAAFGHTQLPSAELARDNCSLPPALLALQRGDATVKTQNPAQQRRAILIRAGPARQSTMEGPHAPPLRPRQLSQPHLHEGPPRGSSVCLAGTHTQSAARAQSVGDPAIPPQPRPHMRGSTPSLPHTGSPTVADTARSIDPCLLAALDTSADLRGFVVYAEDVMRRFVNGGGAHAGWGGAPGSGGGTRASPAQAMAARSSPVAAVAAQRPPRHLHETQTLFGPPAASDALELPPLAPYERKLCHLIADRFGLRRDVLPLHFGAIQQHARQIIRQVSIRQVMVLYLTPDSAVPELLLADLVRSAVAAVDYKAAEGVPVSVLLDPRFTTPQGWVPPTVQQDTPSQRAAALTGRTSDQHTVIGASTQQTLGEGGPAQFQVVAPAAALGETVPHGITEPDDALIPGAAGALSHATHAHWPTRPISNFPAGAADGVVHDLATNRTRGSAPPVQLMQRGTNHIGTAQPADSGHTDGTAAHATAQPASTAPATDAGCAAAAVANMDARSEEKARLYEQARAAIFGDDLAAEATADSSTQPPLSADSTPALLASAEVANAGCHGEAAIGVDAIPMVQSAPGAHDDVTGGCLIGAAGHAIPHTPSTHPWPEEAAQVMRDQNTRAAEVRAANVHAEPAVDPDYDRHSSRFAGSQGRLDGGVHGGYGAGHLAAGFPRGPHGRGRGAQSATFDGRRGASVAGQDGYRQPFRGGSSRDAPRWHHTGVPFVAGSLRAAPAPPGPPGFGAGQQHNWYTPNAPAAAGYGPAMVPPAPYAQYAYQPAPPLPPSQHGNGSIGQAAAHGAAHAFAGVSGPPHSYGGPAPGSRSQVDHRNLLIAGSGPFSDSGSGALPLAGGAQAQLGVLGGGGAVRAPRYALLAPAGFEATGPASLQHGQQQGADGLMHWAPAAGAGGQQAYVMPTPQGYQLVVPAGSLPMLAYPVQPPAHLHAQALAFHQQLQVAALVSQLASNPHGSAMYQAPPGEPARPMAHVGTGFMPPPAHSVSYGGGVVSSPPGTADLSPHLSAAAVTQAHATGNG
jgi:hypothetical protein